MAAKCFRLQTRPLWCMLCHWLALAAGVGAFWFGGRAVAGRPAAEDLFGVDVLGVLLVAALAVCVLFLLCGCVAETFRVGLFVRRAKKGALRGEEQPFFQRLVFGAKVQFWASVAAAAVLLLTLGLRVQGVGYWLCTASAVAAALAALVLARQASAEAAKRGQRSARQF